MSEGTWDDTGPAESRIENARRLVDAVCDEFGAGAVAGLAVDAMDLAPGTLRPVPHVYPGDVEEQPGAAYPLEWADP